MATIVKQISAPLCLRRNHGLAICMRCKSTIAVTTIGKALIAVLIALACVVPSGLREVAAEDAGKIRHIPIGELVVGAPIEVVVATRPKPLRGVLTAFEKHPQLPVISSLAIRSESGETFAFPVSSVLRLTENDSVFLVRYDAAHRRYFLVSNEAVRTDAREKLATTGHSLTPQIEFDERTNLVEQEMEFVRMVVGGLGRADVSLHAEEHPSVIIVSDLPTTQRREAFYQVHGAIAQMATYVRLPTNMPTGNGKPVVFLLSQTTNAHRIDARQVRRELHDYLAEKGFNQAPDLAVHYTRELSDEFLGKLYRDTALDFLASAHSDKPLPRWIAAALVHLGSQRDNQYGAALVASRLRVAGNFEQTLNTDAPANVDPILAIEFARHLYLTNPYAFIEFLFDLKHGESMQTALEHRLGTTLRKEVQKFGNGNGVKLDPESLNALE